MIAVLLVAGCGERIHGLDGEGEPFAVIHGRYTGALPTAAHSLRAGLVWTSVPTYVPYCHEHGPGPGLGSSRTCRDPLDVTPAAADLGVPVDRTTGDFEIPLGHIPDGNVMIGLLHSRVAYASITVFDDVNDDNRLTFSRGCGHRADEEFPEPDEAGPGPVPNEPIYAASFFTIGRQQLRLTYVEGTFNPRSFYYPNHCELVPPQGFSLWSVPNYLDSGASCSLRSFDETIELRPPGLSLVDLSCREHAHDFSPRPPPPPSNDPPDPGLATTCTDGQMIVWDQTCVCPNVRIYTLQGCYDGSDCDTPDWNVPPPADWPCNPASDGG